MFSLNSRHFRSYRENKMFNPVFRYSSLETAVPDLLPRRTRGLILSSMLTRLPELAFANIHFWRDLPLNYQILLRKPFGRFKYQFMWPSIILSLICVLFILLNKGFVYL